MAPLHPRSGREEGQDRYKSSARNEEKLRDECSVHEITPSQTLHLEALRFGDLSRGVLQHVQALSYEPTV